MDNAVVAIAKLVAGGISGGAKEYEQALKSLSVGLPRYAWMKSAGKREKSTQPHREYAWVAWARQVGRKSIESRLPACAQCLPASDNGRGPQ